MNNKRATKRALLTSVMALVMCVVMLVGTTFAWFTDTASTGVNKIQTGNLDVELEYSKDFIEWKTADNTTKVFEDSTLWEPGHTDIVYLRVKNAGTLALKYTLGLGNVKESKGKNVEGDFYYLSDIVKMGTVETGAKYENRAAAIAAVDAVADTIKAVGEKGVVGATLKSGESKTYAMVIYMPTEVGNEANPKNNDPYWAAKLSYGIVANATQATVENDSFGDTYDEKAATVLEKFSVQSGTHQIIENMQANGRTGAVEAAKTAQVTINADVYAVYAKDNSGIGAAIAVWASGSSAVTINGGDFRQVGVPADDPVCDLIYADGSAVIEINGGTFKAVTPANTLNCKDGSNAKITVKGGSFYEYDPSNPTLGDNEVVVPTGYHVVQNGDWFNVVAD